MGGVAGSSGEVRAAGGDFGRVLPTRRRVRGVAVFLAATVGDGDDGDGDRDGADLAGDDADVLAGAIVDSAIARRVGRMTRRD